jgi:hypothetical protein
MLMHIRLEANVCVTKGKGVAWESAKTRDVGRIHFVGSTCFCAFFYGVFRVADAPPDSETVVICSFFYVGD